MMKSGKVRAIFHSQVAEIRPGAVVVEESGKIIHNLPNDFVFIFTGGELPTELLKRAGVKLRSDEVEPVAA